ncbi:hypothetical protein [Helicobacter suis]|uniref:hypothetical protein n=1 Tax=Helicobacter suis TaxID=104628 RepID=UPI0013CFECA7|nr:hypothetical protein [Helicobacter suis]
MKNTYEDHLNELSAREIESDSLVIVKEHNTYINKRIWTLLEEGVLNIHTLPLYLYLARIPNDTPIRTPDFAKECGYKFKALEKCLKKLEKKGFLEFQVTQDEQGNLKSIFYLKDPTRKDYNV